MVDAETEKRRPCLEPTGRRASGHGLQLQQPSRARAPGGLDQGNPRPFLVEKPRGTRRLMTPPLGLEAPERSIP
ncbi:hypothetical protein VTN02DRAFT_3462 [Thermoascus thermophilus]